jgi:hypothetical protein
MSIEKAGQEAPSSRGAASFATARGAMPPRWGYSSIHDGVYRHIAPLELADDPFAQLNGPGAMGIFF